MIHMVQVNVEIDTTGLQAKFDKFPEAKALGVQYAAEETVRTLMNYSPVDHGLLKSWFIESLTEDEATIKTPAEYAMAVNYGSKPHFIYPKNCSQFH